MKTFLFILLVCLLGSTQLEARGSLKERYAKDCLVQPTELEQRACLCFFRTLKYIPDRYIIMYFDGVQFDGRTDMDEIKKNCYKNVLKALEEKK